MPEPIPTPTPTPEPTPIPTPTQEPIPTPINEYEQKYKDLLIEKERLENEKNEIETKKLEDSKEYEKLYTEIKGKHEATKEELKQLKEFEKSIKNELLEQLPEADRKTFENDSIDKIKAILKLTKATNNNGKEPQGGGKNINDESLSEAEISQYNKELLSNGGIIRDKNKHAEMMRKINSKPMKVTVIND